MIDCLPVIDEHRQVVERFVFLFFFFAPLGTVLIYELSQRSFNKGDDEMAMVYFRSTRGSVTFSSAETCELQKNLLRKIKLIKQIPDILIRHLIITLKALKTSQFKLTEAKILIK